MKCKVFSDSNDPARITTDPVVIRGGQDLTNGRNRKDGLRRLLELVDLLASEVEGLTLDEMAHEMGCDRRTAERMRDVIDDHFGLDVVMDDRKKRFRIRDRLQGHYTRPNAVEFAALRAECEARKAENAPSAEHLQSLMAKIFASLKKEEKRKIDVDLDGLARLQRTRVTAGPFVEVPPETLSVMQEAILVGSCVEFDYIADGQTEPKWRRVIPYGLLLGPITYLVGKMPDRDVGPINLRLDRMSDVRLSETPGCAHDDWDLDTFLSNSFGIWQSEPHDVVLRARGAAVARARNWRFHKSQELEEDGDELVIRFRAGGLREMAEHLFTWGGDLVIEGPEELRAEMRERLERARTTLGKGVAG